MAAAVGQDLYPCSPSYQYSHILLDRYAKDNIFKKTLKRGRGPRGGKDTLSNVLPGRSQEGHPGPSL